MTNSLKREAILSHIDLLELEDVIILDDFDDAILGLVRLQTNGPTVLAYSKKAILAELQASGLDVDDAHEHFSFNIECLYAGPGTPVFVDDDLYW